MSFSHAWEVRACTECGYSRRVKVTTFVPPQGGKEEVSWSRLCTACDLHRAAAVHLQAGRRLLAKAEAIRVRRSR